MRMGACTALFPAALLACACGSALGDGTAMPARSPVSAMAASAPVAAPVTPATHVPVSGVQRTPFDFEKGDGHYVGGMARAAVPASKETVLAALDDVPALTRLLPKTKSAKLLESEGASRKVELVQGNSLVTAR